MVELYCDSCGKKVPRAARNVNYVTLLNKDLCLSCHGELLVSTDQAMARMENYQLKTYHEVFSKTLLKMCR